MRSDNGDTRAYDGAIVTLINPESEELRVVHRAGYAWEEKTFARTGGKRVRHVLPFLEVIKRLCREVDDWPGQWRVRTISTPNSILGDLSGARAKGGDGHNAVQSYEASILSKAGRIDLWEGHYSLEHRERYREHGLNRFGQ